MVAALVLVAACSSRQIEKIPANLPLESAFRLVGRPGPVLEPAEARGEVVLIKDRHSTYPGFNRLRPQLRQVQRDNRLLVAYLLGRDYRLLGCEFPLGPIEEDDSTATQYRIIRGRLDDERELDEYGVFQPIRFQLMFRGRLEVLGVEDPDLFGSDLDDFDLFARARKKLARKDLTEEDRAELARRMNELHRKMSANVAARGAAAGRNLARLMDERQATRAMMLIGGAHVPAAAEALLEAGFRVQVVESSRYASEGAEGQAFDDVEDAH